MQLPASLSRLLLPLALASSATLAACQGCRSSATAGGPGSPGAAASDPPTLRLYLASSVAGALEPCGCSKNQLGGFDHLGAYIAAQQKSAPTSLLAAAGPLFFLDPVVRGEQATQDRWKADSIAKALGKMNFAAWAPGANDWAAGAGALGELRQGTGGALLAANLEGATAGAAPTALRDAKGLKVGFIGLSAPTKTGLAPDGVSVKPPGPALAEALRSLKAQGAQILVGLFALPRGEALRLIEANPELHVAAIGKPFEQGEANDKPSPPAMIGSTLVVQPANHLQSVAVVDLYVRNQSFTFQDAAGVGRGADREALARRIDDLEKRIRAWEQNPAIDAHDLDARRAELASLRTELRQLETPRPPDSGSFFRTTMVDIKTDLGRDDGIYLAMLDYYRQVNDHNRAAFADRKPPPPGPDGNRYIGLDACASCHPAARDVWLKTPHAQAYKTLADQHKEFNLDCVKCHVTGYEKPGGSTVTANASLQNVQCEECHGPGGRHRDAPNDKALILGKPSPESCVSSCHHPPHVDGFDPVAQRPRVLGPGHGLPRLTQGSGARGAQGPAPWAWERGEESEGRGAGPPAKETERSPGNCTRLAPRRCPFRAH